MPATTAVQSKSAWPTSLACFSKAASMFRWRPGSRARNVPYSAFSAPSRPMCTSASGLLDPGPNYPYRVNDYLYTKVSESLLQESNNCT